MRGVVMVQIETYLRHEWNPEPTAGRLAIWHRLQLTVERIYQNILDYLLAVGSLYRHLQHS